MPVVGTNPTGAAWAQRAMYSAKRKSGKTRRTYFTQRIRPRSQSIFSINTHIIAMRYDLKCDTQ